MKVVPGTLALLLSLGSFSSLTAQDRKLNTVNLGYAAISGSFAPLRVGFDQGLFTKYGLDLKMAYIQGNRVMMSALTAGEIQLYQGGAEGLVRLVSGGGGGRGIKKFLIKKFFDLCELGACGGYFFTENPE
jgi:ABC-type nitrate/sulfonate/bicarbonate transport system substrate-binding protein